MKENLNAAQHGVPEERRDGIQSRHYHPGTHPPRGNTLRTVRVCCARDDDASRELDAERIRVSNSRSCMYAYL